MKSLMDTSIYFFDVLENVEIILISNFSSLTGKLLMFWNETQDIGYLSFSWKKHGVNILRQTIKRGWSAQCWENLLLVDRNKSWDVRKKY